MDALVFGARTVIRKCVLYYTARVLQPLVAYVFSSSLALSGNKKNPATVSSGKKCNQHAIVFNADRIASHSDIGLSRGGIILFALLSGGDYDKVTHTFAYPHTIE